MSELPPPRPSTVARERLADVARELGADRLAERVERAPLADPLVVATEAAIVGRRGAEFPDGDEVRLIAVHRSCSGDVVLRALLGLAECRWLDAVASPSDSRR